MIGLGLFFMSGGAATSPEERVEAYRVQMDQFLVERSESLDQEKIALARQRSTLRNTSRSIAHPVPQITKCVCPP